jgi:hypothetical protein
MTAVVYNKMMLKLTVVVEVIVVENRVVVTIVEEIEVTFQANW